MSLINKSQTSSDKLKVFLINDFTPKGYKQSGIERYFDGLMVVLNKVDSSNKDSFLELLLNYYGTVKSERLLSIDQVERLYQAYKNNSSLVSYILKIFKETKNEIIKDARFQLLIINNCYYHPKDKFLFQYNLKLFMFLIDFLKINASNFEFYHGLLETVMKMNGLNKFRESKSKLNFKRHYSYLLHQYKRFQNENRTIGSYIELLRICYNKQQSFSSEFLNVLDERLPINYMFQLNQRDLNVMCAIYTLNASCFERLEKLEGDISVSKILIPILKSYGISELFYKKYLKVDQFKQLNKEEKLWFETIVKGQNLVYAENLPFKITKKEVHDFNQKRFTHDLTIKEGLIFSVLLGKGCSEEFASTAMNRISNLRELDYWMEVVEVLNIKELESNLLIGVIDYLYYQKNVLHRNIDLKNKKVENLLDDIQTWHEELYLTKNGIDNYAEFKELGGVGEFYFMNENKEYTIIQLKNTKELFEEGKVLRHCVVTYNERCIEEECQIFSLRLLEGKEFKSLLTIEVVSYVIVQIRGFANRNYNDSEYLIIKKWADDNKLGIGINLVN